MFAEFAYSRKRSASPPAVGCRTLDAEPRGLEESSVSQSTAPGIAKRPRLIAAVTTPPGQVDVPPPEAEPDAGGLVLTAGQREALDAMNDPAVRHLVLVGAAGSGKSTVISMLRMDKSRALGMQKREVVYLAPTALACDVLRKLGLTACTLHSFFRLHPGDFDDDGVFGRKFSQGQLSALRAKLRTVKTLVIDEMSMVGEELLRLCIDTVTMLDASVRFVICGDPFQLSPVGKTPRSSKFWFASMDGRGFSPLFKQLMTTGKVVVLREQMRCANDVHKHTLARMRAAKSPADLVGVCERLRTRVRCAADPSAVILAYHVHTVAEINAKRLAALPGPRTTFAAQDCAMTAGARGVFVRGAPGTASPKHDYGIPAEITVVPGAQVIIRRNIPASGLCNGSVGTIVDVLKDGILVAFPGRPAPVFVGRIAFECYEPGTRTPIACRVQLPIDLAWALTIHKAQGSQFPKVHLLTKGVKGGLAYVGLSRVRKEDDLTVDAVPRPEDLLPDKAAMMFRDALEATAND